jgi:hypothetical protein
MALVIADRVKESCTSPGTGTVTLLGAATSYRTFSAGIGASNTTYYVISDQTGGNWEVGLGTVGSGGTTLARTTVLSSSNSGSLVNFSSGSQDVYCDYTAETAILASNNPGTSGQVLTSGGTGVAPTWTTPTAAIGPITINATEVTANQTITTGTNGFSVGPMTIDSGVTVTVSSGQRWVVI